MGDNEYWNSMVTNITRDIETLNNVIKQTSGLWITSQDDRFKSLLDEANRANGALLGYFQRQLAEAQHFRDDPPPNPNELHKRS